MNESWTITYRNRNNGQRITAAVFAADRQQALDKAYADGLIDGREVWEIESIELHEEALARILISEFAEKQQSGHFACPPLREDGNERGERHAQRAEPSGYSLYLRYLRHGGGAGRHGGRSAAADRMGHRLRAGELAHGGRLLGKCPEADLPGLWKRVPAGGHDIHSGLPRHHFPAGVFRLLRQGHGKRL